jgi:hypothetical protein
MTEGVENQGSDNEAVKSRLKRWLIATMRDFRNRLTDKAFTRA